MNKNSKYFLIVIPLLFVVGNQALAHDSSWYAAVDLGYAKFTQTATYAQPPLVEPVPDESGGVYRIGGGYGFTRSFALEAGYVDAGHTDVGPDAVLPKFGNQNRVMRSRGVTLDAVGTLTLSDAVSIYLRAGLISATTEHKLFKTGSNIPSGPDLMETDTRLGAGAGVAYQLNDNWTLRMQWQRYFGLGGAEAAARYDLSIATLGVAYYY